MNEQVYDPIWQEPDGRSTSSIGPPKVLGLEYYKWDPKAQHAFKEIRDAAFARENALKEELAIAKQRILRATLTPDQLEMLDSLGLHIPDPDPEPEDDWA
jgi:hypothetical protein